MYFEYWDTLYLVILTVVPSHVSGMRCVFAQNHESERDSNISASLSLSSFREKTKRILDTWDGTLSCVSQRSSPQHGVLPAKI